MKESQNLPKPNQIAWINRKFYHQINPAKLLNKKGNANDTQETSETDKRKEKQLNCKEGSHFGNTGL